MRLLKFSLIYLLLSGWLSVQAADWQRESRLREEIIDIIFDGEAVMLPIVEREFLGIYAEAETSTKAVLIIHGRGLHPDWAETVQPLRVGLLDYGWNTLSIQMPVLAKEATFYDYVEIFDEAIPRISAGIEYLREQGNDQIAIIAHSCGVHMSMRYLKNIGDEGLAAYVGVGMGATDYGQPMLAPFPLESLSIPVLDVYGEEDYPAVQRMAPGRWQQIQQAGHPESRQLVIDGADHYFTDQGDVLVEAVGGWLDGLGF